MQSLSELLSQQDIELIRQCLRATAEGPFFPDWEFQTLMGVDRETVATVYKAWPEMTVASEDFRLAVCNSLVNLLGYPHETPDLLRNYLTQDIEDIGPLMDRLSKSGLFPQWDGLLQ